MSDFNSIVEKIETDLVRAVANTLKTLNCQIRDDFETVKSVVSELDASWQGDAASHTIESFDKIKKLSVSRFDVMDSYADFLFMQIGEGYDKTETEVKFLADKFK